ncbi:MAG: glycosyl hydrolase [Anaerolineae bacterium]
MPSLPVGFYPFWFWNDTLSADEVRRQVHEMAEQGVRGFFIHSRQGLGQPYLSEAFFEMVDVAIAAAKREGLWVHLYDEYPYPSGVAGGEVLLGKPRYHATRLVQLTHDLAPGPVRLALPQGAVLSCVAYPLQDGEVDWERGIDLRTSVGPVLQTESYNVMGLTQYNRKRYFASEPTPTLEAVLPVGKGAPEAYRLYTSVQVEVTRHKYWGHYVDVLNSEAVQRFISLTHERYRQRYAEEFGETIASIFVDETAPGWSDGLPELFEEAYGYDLIAHLPALQDPDHPDHGRVAQDFGRLRYQRFCETFEQPIASWCRKHGLAYSGEKPSIRMSQLRYMDIPGCEPGHTKVGAKPDWLQARLRSNAKATASAAYFYDKVGALCECYHSTGWSATLQDAKTIADGLLLAGIRYLVPHGFFYSTHALKKHDAPPTFFFQMPFWPFFGRLSAHVDRIAQAFEGTHIDAEILVVDPGGALPVHEDRSSYPYLQAYEDLLWALMRAHLDYHIVDTDILSGGELEEGALTVADIRARAVVVPAMPVVEPELQAVLDAFEERAGVVVRCERDADPADVVASLRSEVPPSLSVAAAPGPNQTGSGREAEDVLVVKRVGADKTLWFCLNVGRKPLRVRLDAGTPLRAVALDDARPPALRRVGNGYARPIAPFESFLLEAAPEETTVTRRPVIEVNLSGPAEVHPLDANLLRMDPWEMALKQPDGRYGPSVGVPAMPLPNQLAASGLAFAPEFRIYFGHAPEMALPQLTARYTFRFWNDCEFTAADQDDATSGGVELVMEPGSIVGDWRLIVNGGAPLAPSAFGPTAAHVRGSLGAAITEWLRPGENVIQVEVTTDRLDGGLVNPLYLAGDFGVALNPPGLIPPEGSGRFEDYEANGLPFYAGAIAYTTHFELDAVPDGDEAILALQTDAPFHEATEVAVNGGSPQPVLWEPRRIVVPTTNLHAGTNELQVTVYTTLIRAFEGQWFDYEAHQYRDVVKLEGV